jgi:hypothetical protein
MSRCSSLAAVAVLAVGPLLAAAAAGDRPVVAKCVSAPGALLKQEDGKPWQPVRPDGEVRAGDLLVALPRADLLSQDGAVEVLLLADVGHRGPFPVLETAVRLRKDPARDLDVDFDRGILALANRKKEGAAKVRVRIAGTAWDLTLASPGAQVGLEIYSRHPPGLPVLAKGKVGAPVTEVVLLVLKGSVFLKMDGKGHHLHAPPGPAAVRWDSVGREAEVGHRDKLPPNLLTRTAEEDKTFKAICAAAARLNDGPVGPTLDALLKSDNRVDRRVGVTAAGALDDLPRLVGALDDAKHAGARDQAVLVLRNWMGRGPGQVGKLYGYLKGKGGYPEARARTVIQLLFGFGEKDVSRPDTYAVLLELLGDKGLPVRELAHWHLVRLAPAGKDIPYDAGAPAAQRQRAVEQWRALIPAGQLPPRTLPPAEK